jgi:tetratricopeptide (TPR) repeat protein
MKRLVSFVAIGGFLFLAACSQSPERMIESGNKYHNLKKYKEASILYRKAIAKDKTNAEAYYREGLNLIDQGDPSGGAQFLRKAVDLKPDNVDAGGKLAEIYLAAYASSPKKFKGLLPEIKELTEKILKYQPNSFEGVRLQAFVYLTEQNIPKAVESFERALKIKPYSREVVGWLAQAYSASGRPEDAEKLCREMIAHDKTWGPSYDFLFLAYTRQKKNAEAEEVLKLRLQNDPTSPLAVKNMASYYLATNREPLGESVIKTVLNDPKSFPNGREFTGDFFAQAKKYDLALAEYQTGAKEHPDQELPYQKKVISALLMLKRRDEALQLAKTMAGKYPKDLSANEIYAGVLLDTGMKGNVQQSLQELKKLVEANPKEAILHYYLSRAYFETRDMDKSLSEALEASRLAETHTPPISLPGARMVSARIYEDRGQHGKALEQTDGILARDPGNADARLVKDRALIGLNEGDKALPDLEDLVAKYPNFADARYYLANLYFMRKDIAKANVEYEKLWKATPPDIRGYLGMQTVLIEQGKGEEAIKNLQTLVKANPKRLDFVYSLANFQARLGKYADAAENYKTILKSTANSEALWLRLGLVQRELGQNAAALASFEQAQNADPKGVEGTLQRALLLDLMGQTKEARENYVKVLGVDPENVSALNNLAYIDAVAGRDLDQALTMVEKAKKKVPDSADISDTLGFIYYQKNLNPQALQELKSAVLKSPKNATFRLHLAMALLKTGDKLGAKNEADRALAVATPQEQPKIRTFMSQIG